MCPAEALVNVERTFDYCTEPAMKGIFNQMKEVSPNRRLQISKQYSLHPIEVILILK